MNRLQTQLTFNGKIYSREINYFPSDLIAQTPPELLETMIQNNGLEGLKVFKLKADRKKVKQINYLLNQCLGEIGEEIVSDLLTSKGWSIDKLTSIGDFKAISPDGIRHIVEVKTCRSAKRLQYHKYQVKHVKRFCLNNKYKPLFYLVYLEQTIENELVRFNLFEPLTTLYKFRVLRVKSFNYEALTKKKALRPIISRKKLMKLSPTISKKYPAF